MKVGLIQVDGKLPNLALMKLSKYHKNKGDDVVLIDLSSVEVDQWYGSKVFMGGSGYNLQEKLPDDIECLEPDYELFHLDYSIGYTSRGCIRHCGFCIVREKEGSLVDCDMSWIKHQKVLLFDNNFLASPFCKEKLKRFILNKNKVCFNQGLDIRLINKDVADLLVKVKYYDMHFNKRRLYFAFDDLSYEKQVVDGIQCLIHAGVKPDHMMFYVLVGFNTTHEQDLYRIQLLIDYGVLPFVMIFNNKKEKRLHDLSRWVNKRYYKVVPFEQYNRNHVKEGDSKNE